MGGGSHGAVIIRDAGRWSRERSSLDCERGRGGEMRARELLDFLSSVVICCVLCGVVIEESWQRSL